MPPPLIKRFGINPLSWSAMDGRSVSTSDAPALREVYLQVRRAGYTAVHAEVPPDMSPAGYRRLLDEVGLAPAPGYFQASFSTDTMLSEVVADARRTASEHAALGLDRIFVAERFAAPERLRSPARGVGHDPERIERIADNLAHACAAMVEEGVVPCLHQHVGTWIETPEETIAVLDRVDPEILLFGPDTGHLAWAGADVPGLIHSYGKRIGAVHLKDVRLAICKRALEQRLNYAEATALHLWTEPGRGDIDLEAVVRALDGFEGWYIVEVDIPDQPTPELSAAVAAAWIRTHNQRVENTSA